MGSTTSYAAWRLAQAVPTVLGIVILNFVLVRLAPGDVTTYLVGELGASPEYIASVREEFGLNKSIPTQLGLYLAALVQGDMGYSFQYRQPVRDLVVSRMGATLLLMGMQLVIAAVLGIVLGIIAAYRFRSLWDRLITGFVLLAYSAPVFWLAQLLLLLLAARLSWFPVSGMESVREEFSGWARIWDVAHHLVLPALTLSLVNIALICRLMRTGILEVVQADFLRTARAKGLGERTILVRHALRNAVLPVVTVLGMSMGTMLTGAALTETVFGWPGLGRLMVESVSRRDFPVLSGVFLITAVLVVTANIITDLTYAWLDPRIRLK